MPEAYCYILVISAMVMINGGSVPLLDFQDTVRPSADTESLPSCFLYNVAASNMTMGKMLEVLRSWVVGNDVGRCVIAALDKLTKRARAGDRTGA